jgi:NAD(P)-dependent dehydrogenase (short-subunit alcohol dehydrogenase family)
VSSSSPRVALVTGANTGIGLELSRGLLAEGFTVVLGCRDLKKGEAALASLASPNAHLMQVDLANLSRLRNFLAKFTAKFDRLDVLALNAGTWPRTRRRTEDGFELTFGVNHLGHFFLAHELLPLLEKSAPSRVVVLTSSLHFKGELDFEDPMFKVRKHHGPTAYAQSKLANVLFTLAAARTWGGKGVTFNCVHPGVVATELNREAPESARRPEGKLTPAQGAAAPLWLCTAPELTDVTGGYFDQRAKQAPSALAQDVAVQDQLWELSRTLLKL